MKNNKPFMLIRLMVAAVLLCGQAAAQTKAALNLDEAKKAIAASNNVYFQAFAKDDSSIFINRYAKDCWIMPPNAPTLCGPDAPLFFFRKAYDDLGLRNGKFTTTEVYGISDDMVAEVGLWQSFNAGHVEFDNGKYLVLWKKTAKGWKMFRDSFSSNRK